jgi:hypothetical protein
MDLVPPSPEYSVFEKELRQNSNYVKSLVTVTEEMVTAAVEGFDRSQYRSAGVFMSCSVARDMLESVTAYLASRL